MMTYFTLISDLVKEILVEVFNFIPVLTSVLIIVVVGPIVAKLVCSVFLRLFKELKIDQISDKISLLEILNKGGMKRPLSEGMGRLIYWLLAVIFFLVAVKFIGLPVVGDGVGRLLAYVPYVLSAVIVIIFAKIFSGLVYFSGIYLDLPKPKLLERITRWAIVISAGTISLEELGFGSILLGVNFQILLAAVCFAFALSYGLGGKGAAGRHLGKYI